MESDTPQPNSELGSSLIDKSQMLVSINLGLTDYINYAAWQNSVPFIRTIEIKNLSSEPLSNLRLEFTTTPAFARRKQWDLQRIEANGVYTLNDRDIQIDPDYLSGLDEAERGIARLRLLERDTVIGETERDIRVLSRDEWGGMHAMGELLAAFVTPNDPALARLLKTTADVLAKHGHSPALDGYQSGDPSRAYMLAAAIWSAVAAESLTYAIPPSSFEQVGQKTRRVAAILEDGLATCLDSTLLFAATMEAVGLNPVVVMKQGHCFVGVWLVEKTLNKLVETDCSEVRKAIAARELITFETTLVTQQPPGRFQDAVVTAGAATQEAEESDFVGAIDIARARMAQIRPLASHVPRSDKEVVAATPGGPLPLPTAPKFDLRPPSESDEKPTTPDDRINRWQRKLLDLSLRNRLLNFRATQQAIPILCPNISKLEDRLAEGTRLRLISLSDHNPIGDRDSVLHQQKTTQNLDVEFARQALDRDELACSLTGSELNHRLTMLFRKVRNDLAEGGSNTLYLAVGFLKWKLTSDDARTYRAPLLLVPVKLLRRSASSPFYLAHHEDEIRFNATLIQLLKKDFDCDISSFESNLPTDDSGVDVPCVLERIRRAVRDIPGFEVVDETAISTFSFAKYLMWKDLVDRVGQLQNNRVVRHLIHEPDRPFTSGAIGEMPRPYEIDVRYAPSELVHPLPADSSQLAAVMAASEGHDFVLVGPPGTGKSQTIANIIAQCLATRKTVLFVAEKTAALDVVYRRLREHGLGDCCVELHSNKAERRRFFDQLEASWTNNRRAASHDWLTISERLKIRRDELNSYVAAIHNRHPCGWTAYRAMGVSVKREGIATPRLLWADTVQHNAAAYENLTRVVTDLALTFQSVDRRAVLPQVRATDWSAAWEAALLQHSALLKSAATALIPALKKFTVAIGMPDFADCSIDEFNRLNRLAQALLKGAHEDVSILLNKQFSKLPSALAELHSAIEQLGRTRDSAAGAYNPDALDQIPVDDLERKWLDAKTSMWPLSWLKKRTVNRLLQGYVVEGAANPETDLHAIRGMRSQLSKISASPLAALTTYWQEDRSDTTRMEAILKLAGEIREAIISVGQPRTKTDAIAKTIYPALKDDSGQSVVLSAAREYLQSSAQFTSAWRDFAKTAGSMPVGKESPSVASDAIALADRIQASRTHLKQWTAWCEIRKRAESLGLAPMIDALETGGIQASELAERFELAYARWWLPKAIDANPVLRAFQQFKHEDAIDDFRKLDDLARATASSKVRQAIAHDLPPTDGVPRKSELGLLRHQMGLKRPSKSIREMIAAMPESFGKLAPCLLMSPLSIAQYLPADQSLFDVVVFDEASQITTWDAIGAIARAKQTIIVGDPKQLPPTNFFGRADDDEDNEDLDDFEKDLESILDEAQASGLPTLQLNWHYRSRHESLITFSNWNYYGNNLVTFPAAETADRGVLLHCIPTALFDRGKSRTNRAEAKAIVGDVVARMLKCLAKPEEERHTYGVVTFNIQQQNLIQDLFDQAQRDHPELEWFFSDDRIEPTAVKNLENVQGDERDVMFFSITFGFDSAGKFPVNFGALNRDGGERRLNVAITRARRSLIVYSSFYSEQLRAERSQARGVRDLKCFLGYAEKGPAAIAARTEGSVGGYDSPFEEAVSDALASRGWQVETQVGVSGFRVDLGIVHPDKLGAYLAGVECDGATYHRSAAARDRDKTRQQVLKNLGWSIVRVWSPDWWYDSESAINRVHEALIQLLEEARSATAREQEIATDPPILATMTDIQSDPLDGPHTTSARPNVEDTSGKGREPLVARQLSAPTSRRYYKRAELPDGTCEQGRFFDADYSTELRAMTLAILQVESPIREDVLARQVARAHGFGRTGANIRQRILDLVSDVAATEETTGRFLWNSDGPMASVPFRYTRDDEERRSIDEISIAELLGLIEANPHLLNDEDPAIACARELGLARLARSARDRLEEAINCRQ